MKDVAFENRFGMIVDAEHTVRKNNALNRLIQIAELEQPDASIATVDYRHGRKINRTLIERLASTSLNIETSSSPAQQEVARLIWPVHSEWRHANAITLSSRYGSRISLLTCRKSEIEVVSKTY